MTDRNKFNDGGRSGEGENSHKTLEEGVASKILRETQMVGIGVGGAFLDTAKNPIAKAPELAMTGGFGVGLKTLQNAGAKGRAVASVVGLGMAGKMAYDEYMGDRWSTFGSALKDNWQSPENFERNLIATKRSVGALAVDSTVATMGFKAAGSHISNKLLKGEMGSTVPLRVVFDEPHFSRAKSAGGLASTPRSPALLAGIGDAAQGKQIGDHVTPSGLNVSGNFNFPSPMNGSAERLLSFTSRSELLLKDTLHAARNNSIAEHAGPPRKPASPKEMGAASERLPKVEEPVTKPLENHSGNSGAGHVEVPAGNPPSLSPFNFEMYEGIRSRINASSEAEYSGLVGGRAHGGHSSSSFLNVVEPLNMANNRGAFSLGEKSGPQRDALSSSLYSHELAHQPELPLGRSGETFMHARTEVPSYNSLVSSDRGSVPVPYKVLTSDGASPGAHTVKWSLPEQQPNGEWKPGEWLHIDSTPKNAYSAQAIELPSRRALHVSNAPGEWSLGQGQLRVFEVELHPADQALWNQVATAGTQIPASGIPISLRDFPAQEVRLTRELFGRELRDAISE